MWLIAFLFLSHCSYWDSPARKSQKALKEKNCEKALSFFQEINQASPKLKVARKASSVCLNRSPKISLWFYNYLSQQELTQQKRLFFKKKAGDLAFEKIQDYEQALFAYSFLKEQAVLKADKNFYSFRMAFSYFKRGKWESALRTLRPLFEKSQSENLSKALQNKALFLKARIFLMQAEYQKAKTTFQNIRALFPKYFKEQEMFLYLSFIYEEQKDFQNALTELEAISLTELSSCAKADPADPALKAECLKKSESIKEKIKQLKRRQKNQPGATL